MIAQHRSRIVQIAALTLSVTWLSACGGAPPRADYDRQNQTVRAYSNGNIGERVVSIAMQQIGTPYRYGGQGPAGFDCSGLVHYSYLRAGKSVPRTTRLLWDSTTTVSRSDLRAGDLLFFEIAGKMQHVGLYVGNGRFVHAPSTGRHVSVESLHSDFYADALLRAGRPR